MPVIIIDELEQKNQVNASDALMNQQIDYMHVSTLSPKEELTGKSVLIHKAKENKRKHICRQIS